ncbi:endothelin-converting enzyme-like 1 isoform X1 [Dermacentor albipictus]|uniref:endothelin-converting enzyme-like 1 isoform X1 n=1 Tax=Dermacentor albipictus TaxID=60249 RepID=UPI0031FD13E6
MATDHNKLSDSKNEAVTPPQQKEPHVEKKVKRKKLKLKKKKTSLRHSAEKCDVSASTHDSTTTTTSRVSATSSTTATPRGEVSTGSTSISPKAPDATLPVFGSDALDNTGSRSLRRQDSNGFSNLPQGALASAAGSSGAPGELPEPRSSTTRERQPPDVSGSATLPGAFGQGKQSRSRHWGGSLFELSASTRLDDTATAPGSRTSGLFGQREQPVDPRRAGVAARSNAALQGQGKSQALEGRLPLMPPVHVHSPSVIQTDGRGLTASARVTQPGQRASGVGGAGVSTAWNDHDMGYSYFRSPGSATEGQRGRAPKKVRHAISSAGLSSLEKRRRIPHSSVTSPVFKTTLGETTVVAAGLCIFWAAFAVIVLLMRERRASDELDDTLCQTDDCVRHAKLLANITTMSSVDPCEDFAAYVCSVWSPPRLQTDENYASAMDAAIYHWYRGLRDTLHSGVSQVPIGMKAREMYEACVGGESRYGIERDEFLRFIKEAGLSWPEYPPERVDALSVFVSLSFNFEAPAWFSVVISDSRDRKHWRLVISPDGYLPILLAQHRDIVKQGGYVSHWKRIWNSIVPGAAFPREDDLDTEHHAMEDILGKLHEVASSPLKETALFTLGDIGKYTPSLPSSRWVEALNETLPLSPTTATEVYFTDVSYMRTVGDLFTLYNNRQLVRHLSWLFVQLYGPVADPRLLVDRFENEDLANASRPLFCGSNVEASYKLLLTVLYFVSRISSRDKALVEACFDSLIVMGAEKVAGSSWLEEDSKLLAGAKIKVVEARVWPDEVLMKTGLLEQIYKEFTENRSSFAAYWVESRRKIRNVKGRKLYRRLSNQPLSSREPYLSYDAALNHVLIALGALVRPLFYRNGTKGMLYGGIGFLMALEVVKSLDKAGLRWDPSGDAVAHSILSKTSLEEYASRSSCFGPEEGNVSAFPEIPALEVAYAAFQQALKNDGRRFKIGENFNEEQVFFLTLCFTTCQRRYVVSPASADCNKAVQNFPPFAETFSCPNGSNMNPRVQCRFFD